MRKAIKLLLIGLGAFAGLMILSGIIIGIVGIASSKNESPRTESKKKENIDSLLAVIKKDSLYDIRDIYYNPYDSTVNIAFTNKDHMIKEHDYSTYYFDKEYQVDDFASVEGINLFAYKKGKSLYRKEYSDPLETASKKYSRLVEEFKKKYIYSLDGSCIPLEQYIQRDMGDPGSYEHVKTWVEYYGDNKIKVYTRFRGNNAFGGKVLNELTAILDMNGNILSTQ